MGRHPFFESGDRRQLYARDVDAPSGAPLVFMEQGHAPLLRDAARAGRLVCPVPDCKSPRFITRGGSRRDHFAHRPGSDLAGHAPERVHHLHGKSLLVQWLVSLYPSAQVGFETRLESGQVADVYAEIDSRRYAFEIQYSALTIDEWLRRHHGYRHIGVIDVWMFGHIPPQLRRTSTEGIVRLNELHLAVRRAGLPVFWLNPDTRHLGTAMPELGQWSPPGTIQVGVDELWECLLDELGVVTPTLRAERGAEIRRLEEERLEEERYERERTRREAKERQRREAERRSEEEQRRLRERRDRACAINRSRWLKAQPSLEAKLGGHLPEAVTVALASDENLWIYPVHWHALFFEKWLQDRVGECFTYKEAAAHTFQVQSNSDARRVYFALNSYLVFLRKHRYVDFEGNTHWIESEITVLADALSPPQPLPRRDEVPATPSERPIPWSPLDDDDPDRYLQRNDYIWKTSRDRLERMSGGLPEVIFDDLPLDRAVNLHPHHWHAHVYWKWVISEEQFTVSEVAGQLEPAPIRVPEDVVAAVEHFIDRLVAAGLVVSADDGKDAVYRRCPTRTHGLTSEGS